MNDRCMAGYAYWAHDGEREVEFLILGVSWMTPEMDQAREEFITSWKAERDIR